MAARHRCHDARGCKPRINICKPRPGWITEIGLEAPEHSPCRIGRGSGSAGICENWRISGREPFQFGFDLLEVCLKHSKSRLSHAPPGVDDPHQVQVQGVRRHSIASCLHIAVVEVVAQALDKALQWLGIFLSAGRQGVANLILEASD